MARYTRQTVTSLAGINSELTKIQTAIEDTLSRKGDTPNQMEGTFDANSNRILNLPTPIADHEPFRKGDLPIIEATLQPLVDEATSQANRAEQEADRAANEADSAQQSAASSAASAILAQQYPEGQLATALAAPDSDVPVGGVRAGDLSYPVSDIQSLLTAPTLSNRRYTVSSYHPGWSVLNKNPMGGGSFVWQASRPKSQHNGGTVIAPEAPFPADWNNESQKAAWFNFTTSGSGCFVRVGFEKVNVMDFGAKGEYNAGSKTGVNDAKAWQKAIDTAKALGLEGTSAGLKESFISESIFITCAFDGSDTTLQCKGSVIPTADYAVYVQADKTIGTSGLLQNVKIKVPRVLNVDKPAIGWSGQCKGVCINNVDSSMIDLKNAIAWFQIGLWITSYPGAAGTAYNDFYLGRIVFNQVNMLIQPVSTGYVNENNFFSGKLGDTTTDRSTDYLAILPPTGQGFGGPNANKFYGLTVEDGGEGNLAVHILLGGLFNVFIGTRFEFIGAKGKIRFWRENGNEPTDNLFIGGYSYDDFDVTATTGTPSPTNKFKDVGRSPDIDGRFLPIYSSVVTGGNVPYHRLYESNRNLFTATVNDTDWIYQLTNGGGIQTKNAAAAHAQAQLVGDRLYLGNGSSGIDSQPFLKEVDGAIGTSAHDLIAGNGEWSGPKLRMGSWRLWVDASGRLRIKFGAPTSDTDGTVVGTQS